MLSFQGMMGMTPILRVWETVMLKHFLTITALVLVAGAARADDTITTQPGCLAVVDALATKWENHVYASKAESEKVGAALTQLDNQCKANQLSDAQKTETDLKALIK